MSTDLVQVVSQFGAAGLIGLLWLLERKLAAARDRQLHEAHRKIVSREQSLEVMMGVVRDNTRAIVSLEQTQRQLIDLAHRLCAAHATLGSGSHSRGEAHAQESCR